MDDRQFDQLVRMAAEVGDLEASRELAARTGDRCVGMARMQICADNGGRLSVPEDRHVMGCTTCGPRWKAMVASRPTDARPTAPTRWYRYATGITAAAACLAALFTVFPRPDGPVPGGASRMDSGMGPLAAVLPVLATRYVCTQGDSNCDGVVDSADLAAIGMAVHRPSEYADQFPNCDAVCSSDLNGDSIVDECDLDELIQCVGS